MDSLDNDVARIGRLIEQRLGIKGVDFADQLRRCGRWLPRSVRRDGARLAEAHQTLSHPNLSRQVDTGAARAAAERMATHLQTIDPRQRRRTRILGILSVIAFNLLVVFVVLVCVLVWRGFV